MIAPRCSAPAAWSGNGDITGHEGEAAEIVPPSACNPLACHVHYMALQLPAVIKSFRHKGLERFLRKNDARGIQAQHIGRIERILELLDEASGPK